MAEQKMIGWDQLRNWMNALPGQLGALVEEAYLQGAGGVLVKELRQTQAWDDRSIDGLRQSFKLRKAPTDYDAQFYVAAKPHWWLLEYGHGGPKPAPAHSFVEAALLSARTKMQQQGHRRAERTLHRFRRQAESGQLSRRGRRYAAMAA